jgi:hypothetical protein
MKNPPHNRMTPPPENRRGRPSSEALAASPAKPVEPVDIPQPPLQGIRNPPCCGVAMAPRARRLVEGNRYRVQCSACGRWLSVVYDSAGRPVSARVV